MFCNLLNWIFPPPKASISWSKSLKEKEEEGDLIGVGWMAEGGEKGGSIIILSATGGHLLGCTPSARVALD